MLLNWVAIRFENTVREKNLLPESDIEKMTYGLHVILSEVTKIIIYIVFFSIINRLLEFSFACLILFSIRSHSGGLHFYTWLKCFLFTLVFFVLAILILPNITILNQSGVYYFLGAFSIVTTLLLAPKTSKFRPITNKKRRFKSKVFALASMLICFLLLLLLFHHSKLFAIGIWTITLQNTQLFISGGIQNEKNI